MKILRFDSPGYERAVRALLRKSESDPIIARTVEEIVQEVAEKGDKAVIDYTKRFGGPALTPSTLREEGEATVPAKVSGAIRKAKRNVLRFAKASLRKNWTMRNAEGAKVGERFDPFQRVGIYVPGGTAPLVSTAIMTVTLAAAAGVPEIVVTTPADERGAIAPALLHALHCAGATEIYKIGGAQAIAAMAIGTKTIRPVQKIFGPGNAYVVEAKRQVFGRVAIDLLPGPSEVLVIADASANPAWVAADLLAQAEHGKGSGMVLLTNSDAILELVNEAISDQLKTLSRKSHLEGVLAKTAILVRVRDLSEAVALCNAYAPEHVSVQTEDPEMISDQLTSSGAIFLGGYSPIAAGDFMAGPSHTLPTGGAGHAFPGLTADMFQRRTSIIQYDRGALSRSVEVIETFSDIEGLDAHGRSARIRLEKAPRTK